ncbi:hypothetical protein CO154_02265 [Candidatus Pacearchaeota archaeon CG_4_9_14_3_um_filter_31_7]|nr:MAG: hypothetical protein AUJ10_02285 [Candidatus Pacearchaeota archaeon CG1_02_31_27]PIN92521.1 MAG: hypothetical protein COU55_01820 [Candidatus Pacearchaeota archaeon CG10_big_fil_rev_8_21_14_0_10_31_59]PJA70558.1 MAG: hypothetical protein CO154_02265 [Candidatus Pacearchaeota archaeon CG_4_9_14_3_um_filter_31_7]
MEISFLEEKNYERYDKFIFSNERDNLARAFKTTTWKIFLDSIYNYKSIYLISEENSEIMAVFPLVLIKSRLLGNRIVSLPFVGHGVGPCFKKELKEDEVKKILKLFQDKLIQIIKENKVKTLQLKGINNNLRKYFLELNYKQPFKDSSFSLDLSKDEEEIFFGFNKKLRNIIRKGIKSGLEFRKFEKKDLTLFYNLHLKTMKQLGSPPHSQKFFKKILELNKDYSFVIFFAYFDGKAIGAVGFVRFKDILVWYSGYSLEKYKSYNPISFLLWNSIKWAKENKIKILDLDSSRENSGNFEFKKKFNGKQIDTSKLYFYLGKARIFDPREGKMQKLSKLWKKTMPLQLTKIFGPPLRRILASGA